MKQNLSRFFGFFLIFTMLFTGMCQNAFSTDSSIIHYIHQQDGEKPQTPSYI